MLLNDNTFNFKIKHQLQCAKYKQLSQMQMEKE